MIGKAIGPAVSNITNKKKSASPSVNYETNTDYQSLINNAIMSGSSNLARQYEVQRNAKIADMNAAGTNTNAYQQTKYYQPIELPEYKPFEYKEYSYNVNNDEIYKQYAQQFARQGQVAGENALATTSAATGGMPSSYAAAANAQAQQAYAKKTADIIPVLEQNAYNRYQNDRDFNYQDYLSKYNADAQKAQYLYNSEIGLRDFDYQNYLTNQNRQDTLTQRSTDNAYRQNEFDWRTQTDVRDFDYNKSQDAIRNVLSQDANQRAWAQFDYGKEQDTLNRADKKEQMNYERNQSNAQYSYPNTVMGQLETRDQKEAQLKAEDKEMQKMYDIQAWISRTLGDKNPSMYLSQNAHKMTDEEFQTVLKVLKEYGLFK